MIRRQAGHRSAAISKSFVRRNLRSPRLAREARSRLAMTGLGVFNSPYGGRGRRNRRNYLSLSEALLITVTIRLLAGVVVVVLMICLRRPELVGLDQFSGDAITIIFQKADELL